MRPWKEQKLPAWDTFCTREASMVSFPEWSGLKEPARATPSV